MRKTLLLADDSLTIQRVVELTFADEPVDVVALGDGAAAIARLDAEPPDVVLADIGMPGQDGYAVAMHVRQTPALAHIPVILLTGAFDPVDHARVRDAGCAGVLVKPFDPQMLVARVRTLLGARPGPVAAAATPEIPGPPVVPVTPRPPDAADRPAPVPEARALVVDRYFEQLDRAFAALGAVPSVDHTPLADSTSAASAGAAPGARAAGPAVSSAPDRADVTPASPDDVASASPPPASVSTAPAATGSQAADARSGTLPRATLGDAFGALLALEQGLPVPEDVPRVASPLAAHVVELIAARVSREVAERVVRELAPEIVSQVAERLVREEIARLRAPATPG